MSIDIKNLKAKLGALENNISKAMTEVNLREAKMKKIEKAYEDFLSKQKQICFNICGTKFITSKLTLFNYKGSLFEDLAKGSYDNNTIFIDRDPVVFSFLLDYLRTKKINLKNSKLSSKELLYKLKQESEYFEVWELFTELDNLNKETKIISFSMTGTYCVNNIIIGTNKLEDISNKSLLTGICCTSPATLIFKLNKISTFSQLEVGGFTGDPKNWNYENGKDADAYSSLNGLDWTLIGKISKLNNCIEVVDLPNEAQGNFIKLESKGLCGFGYFGIIDKLEG